MLLLGAAPGRLSRQALARAARSLRPRRHGASAARAGARGTAGGAVSRCGRARGRRSRAASRVAAAADAGGGRAADARRRAAAALRARPRARRACRPVDRGAGRLGGRCCPSISPRRSRTACRGSSTHERARRRRLRGRDRLASRRRAAVRALREVRPRVRRSRVPRRDPGAGHPLARSFRAPPFLVAWRAIFDPPVGLFVRGDADAALLERPAVAVVGARSCSPYGASVARTLGRELAAAGLVVVSGLARGVDGEAHRGALEAGGTTVAVLGCGVDRVYPAAHAELARRVAERGLIVSEYAPGVEPAPVAIPGPQPDHRRPGRRHRGRRGKGAKRRADHGRPRARGGAGGVRRAGRDHVRAVGGDECVAAHRGDGAHLGRGRARGVRHRARSAGRRRVVGRRRSSCSRGSATGPPRPTS